LKLILLHGDRKCYWQNSHTATGRFPPHQCITVWRKRTQFHITVHIMSFVYTPS